MVHSPKTRWHRLLGRMLEEWLAPVGITVQTEVPISSDPSKADILLLRNQRTRWTNSQKERLPDGIRNSSASHILIEFKYTESINRESILQILSYDTLYRRAQKLKWHQLESFLLSSKTPRKTMLAQFGYQATEISGVYRTENDVCSHITLVLLNELSKEPNNIPLKCFASRRDVLDKTFEQIDLNQLATIPSRLEWLFQGLRKLIFSWKGDNMFPTEEITPEMLIEEGKAWAEHLLATLPPEERLKGLSPEERLKGLDPGERLKGLAPEELRNALAPEERLKGLNLEVIKAYMKKLEEEQS